jgi:glycosyltransferase involved in cell wall biosynthesis
LETHLTSAPTATPKVSVLMTCYNAASTIEESVSSIIAQTFSDWELVVVDNFSTDNSLTVVKNLNDDRIRIFALDKNHGRTPALSIALENAHAEFVAILDADDISSQDRLQQQFDFLTNNPNILVVGSWYRNIDQHGNLINEVRTPTTSVDVMRRMASDNPIVNSSAMFRKQSAQLVGGYNQKFLYAQDFALWLALASIGELAILPKFLTDIRRVTSSLSSISSNSLILVADNYELYRQAQKLPGLSLLNNLSGKRTVGLYGLLYAWRLLQARKLIRAMGLLIQNLWALPLVAFELLRKGFKSLKSI